MIRLPCTPDEILDMDGRDVIEELFDELDMPSDIRADIESRMWERYGFRPIGMWDVDRWVKITRYVARSNWAWYSRFVDAIKSDDILSTDTSSYTEIADTQAERQESLISEHDGTTGRTGSSTTGTTGSSTTSTTGNSTTSTTGTRTDTVDGTKRTETENKPDTTVTGQKYLDSVVEATDDTTTTSQSNDETTVQSSDDTTVESSDETTVQSSDETTVQSTDNTETTGTDTSITTRSGTRSDGTNVSNLRAVIDEYRRVSQMFVEAFEPSFMNRW
jgi:hypothetical protein